MASAVGEAGVVRKDRVQNTSFRKVKRGDQVDGVEGSDARGQRDLGVGEHALIERYERDRGQELGGGLHDTVAQGETPQLDPQEPARNVLLETSQLAQDGGGIRLAEQDAAERARVEVDGRHASARAFSATLRQEGVGRPRRRARSVKTLCNLVETSNRDRGAEPAGQFGVCVRRGWNQSRDLIMAIRHDEVLAGPDAAKIPAQVLAQLTYSDALGHCASHCSTWRTEAAANVARTR